MLSLHRALHEGWTVRPADADLGFVPGHASRFPELPAAVPGHVHVDLVRAGVIQDPFERLGEIGARWVDDVDWTYRCTFDWTPTEGLPSHVLRFEGLDTVARVELNGEVVAETDNMFVPVEVDVAGRLREGANELVVTFQSAVRVGHERQAAFREAEDLPDQVARFPERAFVRKAQYMSGWDWGPRLVSCGIWRPVHLVEYASRIAQLDVRAELGADGVGRVTVATTVDGAPATARHTLLDPEGRPAGTLEGDGAIEVTNPVRWELLRGGLYSLRTELVGADGAKRDSANRRVGFRTVELIQAPDEHGVSFAFAVNGHRTWIRGANWIPDHSFPSQVSAARYRAAVQRAKEMGMNMLRIWGGGIYELDAFYDACDEAGILVWQDFPHACAYYPDGPEAQAVAEVEARANVRRLRHRASLAIWCGNNENQTMWDSAWGGLEHRPPRLYGDHLYHEVYPRVLGEEDPARPYIYSSPFSLEGDGHANGDASGDSHYWDVWHGRGDWIHYQDSHTRFSSEFGFVSAAGLETWREALAPADRRAFSPAAKWHDKTGKGYDTYIGMVELHYPRPASLEDLVYATQANQRDAMRFALEHYRTHPACEGTLIWQINDCWPVQSWALVDYAGRKKAAGWELHRVYADAMLALKRVDGHMEAWVVNDGAHAISGSVRIKAWSVTEGRVLREASVEDVVREPGARAVALTLSLTDLHPNDTLLVAEMDGVAPTWRLLGEPKDLVAPTVPIQARWLDGQSLQLSAPRPVVDLWLHDEMGRTAEPVLATLLPDAPAVVRFPEGAGILQARSLAGAHALVFP